MGSNQQSQATQQSQAHQVQVNNQSSSNSQFADDQANFEDMYCAHNSGDQHGSEASFPQVNTLQHVANSSASH